MSLARWITHFIRKGNEYEDLCGTRSDLCGDHDRKSEAVQAGQDEIEKTRAVKAELRSKLEPTGYILGDAVTGRRVVNAKAVRHAR